MNNPIRSKDSGSPGPGWNRLLVGFVLGSLLLNGIWLLTHPPGPLSGETPHWWPIILNLAHGRGYTACFPEYFPSCPDHSPWPTATREPLPVLLFAAVARVSGGSLLAASILEMLLDTLVLVSLLLMAREFAGVKTARLAGLLWLLYLPALKLIPQVSGEMLAALGMVSALYFFLRAGHTGRPLLQIAAGLGIGIAALSRSACLVVGPVLCVFTLGLPGVRFGRRMVAAAAVVLGIAVPLTPWIVRNYLVFERPVIGSTLVGYNLYRENYQLPSGDYLRFVAGMEAGRAVTRLEGEAPQLLTEPNEAAADELYRGKAVQLIRQNPTHYATLSGYRFLILWFGWGYLQAYGKPPGTSDYAVMVEQALLLGLALVGIGRAVRDGLPLAASVIVVCLIHMAVISQLRFVVPVMPLAMTLSAAGLLAAGRVRARSSPNVRG